MPDIPMHIITTVLLETGMYLSAEHFGRSLSLALEAVFKSAGWSSHFIEFEFRVIGNFRNSSIMSLNSESHTLSQNQVCFLVQVSLICKLSIESLIEL